MRIEAKLKKITYGVALLAAAVLFVPPLSGAAYAFAGEVMQGKNGSMIVELPGGREGTVSSGLADRLRASMQMEDDAATERSLTAIFRQIPANEIPAASMAAASFSPDRAALISSAAIQADEEAGVKAAEAMRYVHGVRKRQILLGAHASGNRGAYRSVRSNFDGENGAFANGQPVGGMSSPASVGIGGGNRNVVPFKQDKRGKVLPFR